MRNKAVIITAVVCTFLFLGALIAVLFQQTDEIDSEIEIILDGKIIYRGNSVQDNSPVYIDAAGKKYINRIRIDNHGVLVEKSNCPNNECVQMGYLESKYMPIVCLPNNMIIHYINAQDRNISNDVDAISR